MRRSWSALLLGVGLLFLVSLYLPWQEVSFGSGPLSFFAGDQTVDGWSSGVGQAAAVLGLLLVAVAAIALARPYLTSRLPLGRCALFVGYFGIAVGVETRRVADQLGGSSGADFEYAYGAYLGLGGAIVALVAAAAMRREELVRYRSASRLPILVLIAGLLVAFLLPWERFAALGIAGPAVVVAAVLTLCLPVVWWNDSAGPAGRLLLSAAVALFAAADFGSVVFPDSHAYGAWVGLVFAVAIVALALLDGGRISRPARPPWHAVALGSAAALFVTALFLPWQKECYATGSDFGPYSGRCVSENGWTTTGSTAAVLSIALVIATLAPRRLVVSAVELAAGIGILVATLGFELEHRSEDGVQLEYGYGSKIGFAGAALLVALTVARFRPPRLDWSRVRARLVPIAACTGYLVVVVLPWWDVLPRGTESALSFASPSWLTIAGVLLGIGLLSLWARQIAGGSPRADWLVLLPLALLALAALDLIRLRDGGITWGGGTVVGLCLLLALAGLVEWQGRNVRIPEILRVDRI